MKSYVVIGLELFGIQTALGLYEQGVEVLVIDTNEKLVNEYANKVNRAIIADPKDRDALKQIGVDKYDCVIVDTTSDLATSVIVTINLKALGIKEIICQAQDERDKEVLETLGATKVIIPEKIAADRLCKKLIRPNVLDYIEVSDKYGIIEVETPKSWVGKSVIELEIRAKYGVNVIAIKKGDEIEVAFNPREALKEEDVIVILGDNNSLNMVQGVQ